MGRVEDKKEEIVKFVEELESFFPDDFEEYVSSVEKKLASERAFEKIIEAVNDLAVLFIKEKRLMIPNEDEKAFDILAEAEIIDKSLAAKLKEAKGMRNILAHQYDNLDDEIVFNAIHDEIIKDVNDFMEKLR